MSLFYYLSAFDPIVSSDTKWIEDPALYFPVLGKNPTVVFLPFQTKDAHYQNEMIQSLYPESRIDNRSISSYLDLIQFLTDMPISSYLVLEESLLDELTEGKSKDFLSAWSNVLVLSDKENNGYPYSQMRYFGKREREETVRGSYLWCQKPVLDLIGDNALYFMKDVRKMISAHRYTHSVSVAKTAYELALKNGLDPVLCYHAGLLHDMAKDYDRAKALEIMDAHYSSFLPCPDFALHEFIGAYLAKTLYHVPKDVSEMIQYHCTGRAEMTKYMKCLYCADEVEPLREFETEEKRRRCMENLDQGFIYLVEKQLEYFKMCHIDYNEYFLTREKYQYYLNNKE